MGLLHSAVVRFSHRVAISVCLFVYMSFCAIGCSFFFKAWALYFSKCPSVSVSVCPSVCLFTFEVLFKRLFAPTSQSWRSNIFKDSESLGKSNGKKWSQIWTFLFGNGLKSPNKKKFFLADFAVQNKVETTLPDELETSGRRAYR